MTTEWTTATWGAGASADIDGLHPCYETLGKDRPKGGHALAILPGLTHYDIFASPLFAAVVLDLLAGKP